MGVTAYRWIGERDAAGKPVEFFGAPDGLPARDLTGADVAALNAAQRSKLESAAGQRLYAKVETPPPAQRLPVTSPKPLPKKAKQQDAGSRSDAI